MRRTASIFPRTPSVVTPAAFHPARRSRTRSRGPQTVTSSTRASGPAAPAPALAQARRCEACGGGGPAVQDGTQWLAQSGGVATGVRELVMLAAALARLLASEDRAHDRHVFARLPERLSEGLAVPAFDHLRSGH